MWSVNNVSVRPVLLHCVTLLISGSIDERLDLAFRAYDLDGNGFIDREELFAILKNSFIAKALPVDDDIVNRYHLQPLEKLGFHFRCDQYCG